MCRGLGKCLPLYIVEGREPFIFMLGTQVFNQPSHPVSLINGTILWPEFRWVSCSDFCPNVRAVQMSRSFLVHFSFSFYHSCQADYRHVLSRSLARHFYGQNLARVSLRIFVRGTMNLEQKCHCQVSSLGHIISILTPHNCKYLCC